MNKEAFFSLLTMQDLKRQERLNTFFVCTTVPTHILSAQYLHVASGHCIGQGRYRIFSLLQKVLRTVLEWEIVLDGIAHDTKTDKMVACLFLSLKMLNHEGVVRERRCVNRTLKYNSSLYWPTGNQCLLRSAGHGRSTGEAGRMRGAVLWMSGN